MNKVGRKSLWLATWYAALAMLPALNTAGAGFEIHPGAVAEFATVRQGRAVLGARDKFIEAMNPFNRMVRMQTNGAVTEAQFVRYIQSQVLPWSAADIAAVTNALGKFAARTRDWNLAFPKKFYLVKTTGQEEDNAAYLRGASIIIPQRMLIPFAGFMRDASGGGFSMGSAFETQLATVLAHELFHLYDDHNPQLRPALYGVLGFQPCNEIPLPAWLVDRRMTAPPPHNFFITVQADGQSIPCLPVFYAKSTNYTGGGLFNYLESRLMVLEPAADGYRPSLLPGGEPRLLSDKEVAGYFEQIGRNTSYNIHPEETLAVNFSFLALGREAVQTPRILTRLLEAIQSARPASPGPSRAKTSPAPKGSASQMS